MGLFSPKYPKSDTPGVASAPAKRESRADRKHREQREVRNANLDNLRKGAERASKERSAGFWDSYERRNGKGSVDWSGGA
ncbi:hypothetical protein [Streptomyces mirabilis]|uniref:hypothetical protein n=1 Tax=Streptomyces mirabilis TaxID=68239 RepID=UPI0036A0DB84